MRKLILLVLLVLLTLPLRDAFAYSWYWGSDPEVNYTAHYSYGIDRIPLPFTVAPDGLEWVGTALPAVYYSGTEISNPSIQVNMHSSLYKGETKLTQTTYIPEMFFLVWYVPVGSYTDDGDQTSMDLAYFNVPGTWDTYSTHPENHFTIYVDDSTQPSPVVPEPASLSLLGLGLGGVFLRKKR